MAQELAVGPGLLPMSDAIAQPIRTGAGDLVADAALREHEEPGAAHRPERGDPPGETWSEIPIGRFVFRLGDTGRDSSITGRHRGGPTKVRAERESPPLDHAIEMRCDPCGGL